MVNQFLTTTIWYMIVRRRVSEMMKKVVIGKEIMKVKGNYKVILIKKEDFFKVLKRVKLKILDKEYEALMPPLDDMQKNTIDVNGLAVIISQYMSIIITGSGNTSGSTPAQMFLTTSGGTVTLSYASSVNINTQGVNVYTQVFQESGNFVWQYYYVGYDTTNNSYTTSQIELYASAYAQNNSSTYYTDIIRIAYANASFTKSSDSYLFIVWLIQFQNIPPYTLLFIPTLQNNNVIKAYTIPNTSSYYSVYLNNGNCTFECNGNCPVGGLKGFVTYVQNNSIIMEIPVMISVSSGTSSGVLNPEILICGYFVYNAMPNISASFSTTLSPPVSGSPFYLALATITIIFQTL